MGELDDLARAAETSQQKSHEQLRELRKANEHLKSIRGWISFLGTLVGFGLILCILGMAYAIIAHMHEH